MTDPQIQRQIEAMEEWTQKLLQSKEACQKYLEESGILKILEDGGLLSTPVKGKKKK